jgi:adiponectin receptor
MVKAEAALPETSRQCCSGYNPFVLHTITLPRLPAQICGSTNSKPLLTYDEIPHWQRDHEFILSGYRKTTNSVFTSSESIFALHNETISIHTHLGGALLFIYLDWAFWFHGYHATEQATFEDPVVFSVYLIGVAVCFLLSTICHITWNYRARYASLGNRLDYLGIIILMWGASVPSIYYGLRCDPHLQLTYWAMMTTVAAACAVVTMHLHFRNPMFRKYRAAMYAGLGSIYWAAAARFFTSWLSWRDWRTLRD